MAVASRVGTVDLTPVGSQNGLFSVLHEAIHRSLAAAGLTKLFEDLRARGLMRVKEFSWDRSVRRVREIYGEVMDA